MEMSKAIELRMISGIYGEKAVTSSLAKGRKYQLKPFKVNEGGRALYGDYGVGINNEMISHANNRKVYQVLNAKNNYSDPLFDVSVEMGMFLYPFVSVGEMV